MQGGFIETKHFVTKEITTKKYYQRTGEVAESSFGIEAGMITIPPETEVKGEDVPFADDDMENDFDNWDDANDFANIDDFDW